MLGSKSKSAGAPMTETQQKIGTIIGPGAIFNGDLTAPEAIRGDGYLYGNCTCDKNLILGPNGQIKGNISAQNIVISGKVEGDICAQGKMEILSTGKVTGDITAKSLVIDEDAYFDGRCTMATGAMTDTQAKITAKNPMESITIPSDESSKKDDSDKK